MLSTAQALRGGAIIVVVASLWGCSTTRHRYHDVTVPLSHSGSVAVAVATVDQRQRVKSGEVSDDFVGIQRGGYGNPFTVKTESGRSLGDDMSSSVASSLAARGYKATPIHIESGEQPNQVAAKLRATGADRSVVIELLAWHSDCYSRVGLTYDVVTRVLDRQGQILAQARVNGLDNLGGNIWNPGRYAAEEVPLAFAEKLRQLLDHPQIAAALSTPPGPVQQVSPSHMPPPSQPASSPAASEHDVPAPASDTNLSSDVEPSSHPELDRSQTDLDGTTTSPETETP